MAASKMEGLRAKMGSNVGESIGANRQPRPGLQTATPAGGDPFEGTTRRATARTIPLDKIEPDPDQPRKTFDQASLLTMASSLLAHGQLQAIKVRRDTSTAKFLIISGERRYRASILAGLKTIEADVIEDNDSARVFIKQLVENCVREDMAPLDQARAFRKAIDTAGSQFDTAAKLAAELGLSEAGVSRSLALLNLPESVQAMVVAKTTDATKERGGKPTITPTQAYEISKAPREMQEALVAQIIDDKLTVMGDGASRQRGPRASEGDRSGAGGGNRRRLSIQARFPSQDRHGQACCQARV